MTYSASESICREIAYDLQYDRQITVAAEEYLRAWMVKSTYRGSASPLYCHSRMPDKGRIILYYVIRVATGTEDKVEEQVKVMMGSELYDSCFHSMRRMKKKFRGEWKEVLEKLLPGYVFITSDHVHELYQKLKNGMCRHSQGCWGKIGNSLSRSQIMK